MIHFNFKNFIQTSDQLNNSERPHSIHNKWNLGRNAVGIYIYAIQNKKSSCLHPKKKAGTPKESYSCLTHTVSLSLSLSNYYCNLLDTRETVCFLALAK